MDPDPTETFFMDPDLTETFFMDRIRQKPSSWIQIRQKPYSWTSFVDPDQFILLATVMDPGESLVPVQTTQLVSRSGQIVRASGGKSSV